MSIPVFHFDNWMWKSLKDYVSYRDLYLLITNVHVRTVYKESLPVFSLDLELHLHPTAATELRDMVVDDISNSLTHFASLTIVSICTTYEAAGKEFFTALFYKYSYFMHDYIKSENHNGAVSLKEIVDTANYEKLISIIADRAASVATKGGYGNLLRRACKLCKGNADEKVISRLVSLQKLRNKIAHEKNSPELTLEEVKSAQSNISQAIETLGHLAIQKELPGEYSYINPSVRVVVGNPEKEDAQLAAADIQAAAP